MGALSGAMTAVVLFSALFGSVYLIIRRSEREGQKVAINGVERSDCPHHLHQRLRVYTRPLRRFGRKDVFPICAGCGKRMGE